MRVPCPRCGRIWNFHSGDAGVVCNCHLYCEDGTKPSDCTVTKVAFNGQLGWPQGLHVGSASSNEPVMDLTYYCSTHGKYTQKEPVWIEADWNKWLNARAPKRLRMSHGKY
jgi:hypothetical protein